METGGPVWCREQGNDVVEEYNDRSDGAGEVEGEGEEEDADEVTEGGGDCQIRF